MTRPLPSPMARMAQARTARMEALDRATTARLENDTSSAIARYIAQYHPANQMEMGSNPQMFAQQESAQAQARMGHQLMGHYQQMERQLLTDDLTRERMEEEYRLRDLVRRRAHWRGRGSKKDRIINRYEKYQSIATAEGNSAKGLAAKKKSEQMRVKYPWIAKDPRAIAPEELPIAKETPREYQQRLRSISRYSGDTPELRRLRRRREKLQDEVNNITALTQSGGISAMEAKEKYGDTKLAISHRMQEIQKIDAMLQGSNRGPSLTSSIRQPTGQPRFGLQKTPQGDIIKFDAQTGSWVIVGKDTSGS